jgi:hypothetical protein
MIQTKSLNAPSIDPKEIAYFEKLAHRWWDANGPFWPLHRLNAFRVDYIREHLRREFGADPVAEQPLEGLHLLDIGSGGGILSESISVSPKSSPPWRAGYRSARNGSAPLFPVLAWRGLLDCFESRDVGANQAVLD